MFSNINYDHLKKGNKKIIVNNLWFVVTQRVCNTRIFQEVNHPSRLELGE
jgi:hypothetical protein